MAKLKKELGLSGFRNDWEKIQINIHYTGQWTKGKIAQFFKQFGITHQQFNILRILDNHDKRSISVVDIKSNLLENDSDVPRLLGRMVEKNLVNKSRSKLDKRCSLISLTQDGKEKFDLVSNELNKMDQIFYNLSKKELKNLNKLLDKIRV